MSPDFAKFRYFNVRKRIGTPYYALEFDTVRYLFKVGNGLERDGVSPGWLSQIEFTYDEAVAYGESLVPHIQKMSELRHEASNINKSIIDKIFADYNAQERAKR